MVNRNSPLRSLGIWSLSLKVSIVDDFLKMDWKYVERLHCEGMNNKEISERIGMLYPTLIR